MRICYHGTSSKNAESISREGFRSGTWFASHLENAIAYGGLYVFEVVFEGEDEPPWQFCTREPIPPSRVVALKAFTQAALFDNKDLRKMVFDHNTA